MGMTNKQYQGFIRAIKELAEEKIKSIENNANSTKEDALKDMRAIKDLLQSMLEDVN